MSNFPELVAEELNRARGQHGPAPTLHHGYGLIQEEVDEFWDEVKKRVSDPERLLAELVQIGAMAQKVAEDLLMARIRQTPCRPEWPITDGMKAAAEASGREPSDAVVAGGLEQAHKDLVNHATRK